MKLAWLFTLALSAHAAQLAAGTLLAATEKSQDPDFAGVTVVLIQSDRDSAIGLILNHPTKIPVGDLLPGAKAESVIVYAGGPVAIGLRGLVRTKSAPFFRVVINKSELLKLIASSAAPNSFRIYAGYVGWTAGQLQDEVARGLWKVRTPSPDIMFNSSR